MAANKRLYYAIKQVGLKPYLSGGSFDTVYGAQDISVSTNFTLSQVFELGQLEIYEQIEELPDVEVTVSKVFDGKPLIWHLATKGATAGPTLANRSNERATLALGLFPDTNDSATGTPNAVMECSGMYPQTLNYTFGIDGGFTESVTLVGNDKIFSSDDKIVSSVDAGRKAGLTAGFPGSFTTNADSPSGLESRQGLDFTFDGASGVDINGSVADPDATILPREVDGISSSGTNDLTNDVYGAHIQSITVSTDLGRESLNELGRRLPYHRYATFPTEVTCAIEAYSLSGDNISATEGGIYSTSTDCTGVATNTKNRTIRIATCGGVRLYLGTKNRLSSVDYGGGSTDGGNDTNTYNFTNFNVLTVMAEYDPNSNGSTWWTNRSQYLVNN